MIGIVAVFGAWAALAIIILTHPISFGAVGVGKAAPSQISILKKIESELSVGGPLISGTVTVDGEYSRGVIAPGTSWVGGSRDILQVTASGTIKAGTAPSGKTAPMIARARGLLD